MTAAGFDRSPLSYADSGVDVDAGNALVDRIKGPARATARAGLMGGIGGFGGLFDLKAAGFHDPILISGTDGVGTKLEIALAMNRHDTIGQDLVAMCVNDILVQGAEPLFFLDYYACGKLDVDQAATIVTGIADACRAVNCALLGGETAEMPGLYSGDTYDLAGFVVGAVERNRLITGDAVAAGDCVIGLPSSGVHSNGFSLVRRVVRERGFDYHDPAPFDAAHTLGDALLTPTRLYVRSILAALRALPPHTIKAMAHITGGGLIDNIPRILPPECAVVLNGDCWQAPPVMGWLYEQTALDPVSFARTFNCGIGYCLIVPPDDADQLCHVLQDLGEHAAIIGTVVAQTGDAARVHLSALDRAFAR